jgi:hypothetical protein
MACPFSPKEHKGGVVCEHYYDESHTCNDAIDQSYCGAYNRLVGGTSE